MAIRRGPRVSWGLAVNLAVSRGDADLATRTWSGRQPCVTRAVAWVAGSDRHRTQVRQHDHTQVTRSPPMGKRCHPVLGDCSGDGRLCRHGGVRRALQHVGRWPPEH
jgi:hypothetical protein